MTGYASDTTVRPEKTRAEIETALSRYGADKFACGWDGNRAVIVFRCKERLVRFELPIPELSDSRFARDGRGRVRGPADRQKQHEQAVRSSWRRLLLCIKAKLESVASGIETFEEAFLAHVVIPGGATVGQWMGPQLDAAYTSGVLPQQILALPAAGGDTA